MRDIKKQRIRAAADMVWAVSNSIYQSMPKESQITLEATKCIIEILDANYKKTNLREINEEDCLNHCSAKISC